MNNIFITISIILSLLIITCYFLFKFSVPKAVHINSLYRRLYFVNRTIQWLCPYPNETTVKKVLSELEHEKEKVEKEIVKFTGSRTIYG